MTSAAAEQERDDADLRLTLTAPAAFWTALRLYAQWLVQRAEASEGYFPRNGAVEAAKAFLSLPCKDKWRQPERTLSLSHWSWLARGLYEAEQARDTMPEDSRPSASGVPQPFLVAQFLAWLLWDYWPMFHGQQVVDLRGWCREARYSDWET